MMEKERIFDDEKLLQLVAYYKNSFEPSSFGRNIMAGSPANCWDDIFNFLEKSHRDFADKEVRVTLERVRPRLEENPYIPDSDLAHGWTSGHVGTLLIIDEELKRRGL